MIEEFLKKVEIYGAIIIFICSIITALFWDGKAIVSLILGGVFGLANLRWIYKTVKGIVEVRTASRAKMAFLSVYILKLGILGLLFIMIYKTGRFNTVAFLAGFTIILAIMLFEGMMFARKI